MIIETQNLTKKFGKHDAVSGISLSVPEGATVALIGANGAGKTTTLRMLMNLLEADAGEARVLGVDSRRLTAREYSRIGYVSENQKLPPSLTTEHFFAYLRPLYSTWDRTVEDDMRRRFALQPGQKLGHLSHGMQMKVCLAAALPHRPALLVLDEPLANSAAEPGPTDLAFNIVGGQQVQPTPAVPPAPPPFIPRTAISLPVAELDKVAGRYDFGSFVVAITRDGEYLYGYAQREGVPGAPRLQIVPEAPLAFFWKAMDAHIRFTTDASGMVTGAVLTQGRQMVGRRVAP